MSTISTLIKLFLTPVVVLFLSVCGSYAHNATNDSGVANLNQNTAKMNYFTNETSRRLTLVATIVAKEGRSEELKSLLFSLIAPTRAESGCESYSLYRDLENPDRFIFHETWSTHQAWDKHMQSEHLKEFGAVEGLLVDSLSIDMYQRSEAPSPISSRNGLVLFAKIKAKEGKEAELQNILESLIPLTTAEDGNEHYELHIHKNDEGVFLFHETWSSEQQWTVHMNSDHIKDFLAVMDQYVDGDIDIVKSSVVLD